MTFPIYPDSAPRSRPAIVTVACYLLYTVAAFEVINAIATFTTIGAMSDALKDVYAGTAVEGSAEGIVTVVYVIGAVINVLLGAGFAVLAIFNGQGRNPSRIITWVIGGISLCCVGTSLGGGAFTSGLGGSTSSGGPSQADVQRRLDEALPSWYTPVTVTVTVLVLIGILATVILLALPASNEFFRKPKPGWDPATGQPYPGLPYPGQPYAGQPYPGQPYPGQPYPGQAPAYPPSASSAPFGQQGRPGEPAPGLPPYPGQPPVAGQPAPGEPGYPPAPAYPVYPGQPSASTPPVGPPSASTPPAGPPSASTPPAGLPPAGPSDPTSPPPPPAPGDPA